VASFNLELNQPALTAVSGIDPADESMGLAFRRRSHVYLRTQTRSAKLFGWIVRLREKFSGRRRVSRPVDAGSRKLMSTAIGFDLRINYTPEGAES
jgi:hypothetical protein